MDHFNSGSSGTLRWRNAVAFGKSNKIPVDVKQFLLQKFEEVWRVLGDDAISTSQAPAARRENYIKWCAPPSGWLSLNSNGAAKGSPGPAGGGGLIRDEVGRLKYAYSLKLGSCCAFKAEVLAVEYGLELAKRMNVRKLQIQLDNQAVSQILNNTSDYQGECFRDVQHCKNLIRRPEWEVEVKHVYREANQAADWLTNQGVNRNNKFELIQVPPPPFSLRLYFT